MDIGPDLLALFENLTGVPFFSHSVEKFEYYGGYKMSTGNSTSSETG